MQKEKLSSVEKIRLNKYIENKQQKVIMYSIGILTTGIVLSLIPLSFLPKSRRLGDGVDQSLNMIQSFGFSTWLIIFVIMTGVLIAALVADSKLLALKKDAQELTKINTEATVTKVFDMPSQNVYQVIFKAPGIKKIAINTDENGIRKYKVGQTEELTVLKNSHLKLDQF